MIYKVKCQTFADSSFSKVRHCYYFLFYIILIWKCGVFDLLKTSQRGAGFCDQHKKPNRFIFEYIWYNLCCLIDRKLKNSGQFKDNTFYKKTKQKAKLVNNVGELGIRVKEQNVGGEEKEVEEIMKSKSKMHNAAAPGGLLSSHPLMLKLWCWLSFLFQLYFFHRS